MSVIDRLPDFSHSIMTGETVAFAPFAGTTFIVVPSAVRLAAASDGRPQFSLQMVKRVDELSSSAGQYAVLDVQLVGDYPLDEALLAARNDNPDSTVRPAPLELGYARLLPASPGLTFPDDLTAPAPLGWSSADGARWTHRLDLSSGELLKGALAGNAVLFAARVEFTILGVAARLPVTITFDPAELLDFVIGTSAARGTDTASLISGLMRPPESLPIKIVGSTNAAQLAQVLCDRLFAAFGNLVPAPGAGDPPNILFSQPDSGPLTWDLHQPVVVPRAFVIQFDMITSLREAGDPSALVHEIAIPALDLGFHTITIGANLPDNRLGIPAIGVRIEIAPNPPLRPSGVSETLVFTSPSDEGAISVRLSPGEELQYRLTCFAVLAVGSNVFQCEAEPVWKTGDWVRLQATDFPLTFVHVTAGERLLSMATVSGTLGYTFDERTVAQTLDLSRTRPDIAVAIPQGATEATIALTATALDGKQTLAAPEFAPGRIQIDVTCFPDYGPHRVPVSCAFGPGDGLISVDLAGEDGANPSTVHLVPSAPTAMWGYVAQSPFHAGYRYRKNGGVWSDVMPANAPLHLTVN